MSHAEICPVCKGTGRVPIGSTGGDTYGKPCHGCGGRGWVPVDTPASPPCDAPWNPPISPWQPCYPYADPRWPYYQDWRYTPAPRPYYTPYTWCSVSPSLLTLGQ